MLAILLLSAASATAGQTCSNFVNNKICSTIFLVATISDTENPSQCQIACNNADSCKYFSWVKFIASVESPPACFLFSSCEDPQACESSCDYSLTGPGTPAYPDICCKEFSSKEGCVAHPGNILDAMINVPTAAACQKLCQDLVLCEFFFYELDSYRCFLIMDCDAKNPCDKCWSGPKYPIANSCPSTAAVLLADDTVASWPCDLTIPDISMMQVFVPSASAAVLGSEVFLCGGFKDGSNDDVSTCSVLKGGTWQEGPSMAVSRTDFPMISVGDMLVATGGVTNNGFAFLNSVDILLKSRNSWELASWTLTMKRGHHCAVALSDTEMVIAGGKIYDDGAFFFTSSVEKYNIFSGAVETWPQLPISVARLACSLWENNLIVSGGGRRKPEGGNTDVSPLVFKLDLSSMTWTGMPSLNIARYHHAMGIFRLRTTLGTFSEDLAVIAGETSTVEVFNGLSWETKEFENEMYYPLVVQLPCPLE